MTSTLQPRTEKRKPARKKSQHNPHKSHPHVSRTLGVSSTTATGEATMRTSSSRTSSKPTKPTTATAASVARVEELRLAQVNADIAIRLPTQPGSLLEPGSFPFTFVQLVERVRLIAEAMPRLEALLADPLGHPKALRMSLDRMVATMATEDGDTVLGDLRAIAAAVECGGRLTRAEIKEGREFAADMEWGRRAEQARTGQVQQ